MFTFIGAYQNASCGLMCTCLGYFVPISLSRSAGGGSNIQSALPFSTADTSDSASRVNL